MLGCKAIAVIFLRKFSARRVESHFERRHVRLDEDIWGDDLGGEVDALAVPGPVRSQRRRLQIGASSVGAWFRETRVLVPTHVVPRPSEKAAFLDRRYVVGD